MDLKDYIHRQGWRPLQMGDAELAELTCRIQIGTPEQVVLTELREVRVVMPHGYHHRQLGGKNLRNPDPSTIEVEPLVAELGDIAPSQKDKAEEIKKVYGYYAELVAEEYGRINKVFRKKEFEAKGGLGYYRTQRPFYFVGGVLDPPSELNKMLPDPTCFDEVGITGGLHPDFLNVLERAKHELESMPLVGKALKRAVIDSIPRTGKKKRRMIGGWNPRPIVDSQGRPTGMSGHHVGLAVDIKAKTNPHLKGDRAKAIDAVLDHLTAKGAFPAEVRVTKPFIDYGQIARNPDEAVALALSMWLKLMSISAAFTGFIKENLAKRDAKQPMDKAVEALLGLCIRRFGGGTLRKLVTQGLFDENLALVVALVKAGARYGGEFGGSKDEHHFELRNWNRRYTRPACIAAWDKKKSKEKEGVRRPRSRVAHPGGQAVMNLEKHAQD